jgi:peptidoglycan/xylan/chitin deacetylase (PgdA/CDA1 family)
MRRLLLLILALGVAAAAVVVVAVLATRDGSKSSPRSITTVAQRPKPRPPPPIRGPHNRPVPILMYHVIGPVPPGASLPELYVSRADFAGQLRWLASHGYHAVTLRAVYRYWRGRRSLPKKPVVLTFDDGYRGDFTIAAPLLKARMWPAVLNLEYAKVVHGDLSAAMIRRMLADGWELASHTLTHPDLTTVDETRLRREIKRSRKVLRRRFGVRVDFFCYPSGRYDPAVIRAVRAAGYLGATTTEPGLAGPRSPFSLNRIRIDGSDGVRGMAAKLETAGA